MKQYLLKNLLIISLVSPLAVHCQQLPFSLKIYTAVDGLPDSYIASVYQDNEGYIWASSFYGFSRFDGKQFVNHSYINGFPALSGTVGFEDKQHRLFVSTTLGLVVRDEKGYRLLPTNDSLTLSYIYE